MYKGADGWGWIGNRRRVIPSIMIQAVMLHLQQGKEKAQSRGQTGVVVSCSLAPLTSLLMLSKGFTGSVVHLHGFTGLAKTLLLKQTWPALAMYLVRLGRLSARVQL